MLLPHAQREANPPCPQLLSAPAHSPDTLEWCRQAVYRLQGPQNSPAKKLNSLQHREPSQHTFPPKPQQVNHMAVLARRISRGHVRWKEESHDSGGGFIKPPVQRISKELVNYCS